MKNDAPIDALPFVPRLPAADGTGAEVDIDVPFEFAFDSHYDVLGISSVATSEEIRQADEVMTKQLDRLARHKDETANQRLMRVRAAQQTLTKPEKREEYDRQAETIFLSTQDPYDHEPLDFVAGLQLIEAITMGESDPDPLREANAAAESGALPISPLLESTLGQAGHKS